MQKPAYRRNGFTLIEMMIVVAVIAIVAAIAIPGYQSSVLKGKRAQGRTAIAELLQHQERYMTQNNCYLAFKTDASGVATPLAPTPAGACGGITATDVPFKTLSGDNLANSAYLLSAAACTVGGSTLSIADCVNVTATPVNADPQVGALSMSSTGVKDCTGTSRSTNSSLCWP